MQRSIRESLESQTLSGLVLVDECYRRAQQARSFAEMASMPSQKTHFLDLEQRWLRAAESVTSKTGQETKAPIVQLKIATPDVDQTSQRPQEKDVQASRRTDEDERARSANLDPDSAVQRSRTCGPVAPFKRRHCNAGARGNGPRS